MQRQHDARALVVRGPRGRVALGLRLKGRERRLGVDVEDGRGLGAFGGADGTGGVAGRGNGADGTGRIASRRRGRARLVEEELVIWEEWVRER